LENLDRCFFQLRSRRNSRWVGGKPSTQKPKADLTRVILGEKDVKESAHQWVAPQIIQQPDAFFSELFLGAADKDADWFHWLFVLMEQAVSC
jgi:hypothetical protein